MDGQQPFGIRNAVVKQASPPTPAVLRFSNSFHLALPLTAEVVLNGTVSSTGQCADVTFATCTFTPSGGPGRTSSTASEGRRRPLTSCRGPV